MSVVSITPSLLENLKTADLVDELTRRGGVIPLTQALITRSLLRADAGQLRRAMAERISGEAQAATAVGEYLPPDPERVDPSDLDEAASRWRRGDKREALHYLELALGSDFYGLEAILK